MYKRSLYFSSERYTLLLIIDRVGVSLGYTIEGNVVARKSDDCSIDDTKTG